jgi:hypothetical protein
LLTLVLVPVVYVAMAGGPPQTHDEAGPPRGTTREQPSLFDTGMRR